MECFRPNTEPTADGHNVMGFFIVLYVYFLFFAIGLHQWKKTRQS